jgi:integrase
LKSIANFVMWCDKNGESPTDLEELDEVVCDYIHWLWESNGKSKAGKAAAKLLINGISFFLNGSRGKLFNSDKAVRGWDKLAPSVSYPPLTWPLCCAMAVKLARCGYFLHGLAVLLQFDCFLRISELTRLKVSDIALPGDSRVPEAKQTLIRLRHTKTGSDQSVYVESSDVSAMLADAVKGKGSEALIFGFSASQYRNLFKRTCASLGLSERYVPHSCRHGAATAMYRRNPLAIEAIKVRGRWKATESAKRYIQQSEALLLSVRVPSAVHQAGTLFATNLLRSMSLASNASTHK